MSINGCLPGCVLDTATSTRFGQTASMNDCACLAEAVAHAQAAVLQKTRTYVLSPVDDRFAAFEARLAASMLKAANARRHALRLHARLRALRNIPTDRLAKATRAFDEMPTLTRATRTVEIDTTTEASTDAIDEALWLLTAHSEQYEGCGLAIATLGLASGTPRIGIALVGDKERQQSFRDDYTRQFDPGIVKTSLVRRAAPWSLVAVVCEAQCWVTRYDPPDEFDPWFAWPLQQWPRERLPPAIDDDDR